MLVLLKACSHYNRFQSASAIWIHECASMQIGVFTLRGTDPDSRMRNDSISREKHMIGTYTYAYAAEWLWRCCSCSLLGWATCSSAVSIALAGGGGKSLGGEAIGPG